MKDGDNFRVLSPEEAMVDLRQTHTFAELEVSPETYDEIAEKLRAAGYDHAFVEVDNRTAIDMHGIGLICSQGCPDCLGTGRGSATDPEAKCETCGGPGLG